MPMQPRTKKRVPGLGKMGRRGGTLILLGLLLILLVQPAIAQNYLFEITQSTVDVYVNQDATVTIDYTYVFQNSPSASPIDIIDIGMPTNNYDLGSISATIDGQPVERIAESTLVDPGVEIHLGGFTIPPGGRGELAVHIGTVRNMVFHADTQEAEPYASFQFVPNYYGNDFVQGRTDMTVTLYLPPGMNDQEPRWFNPEGWPGSDEPDESGFDDQDRVYYRWTSSEAVSSREYVFGAAFPARLVDQDALMTDTSGIGELIGALCPFVFCAGFIGFIALTIYGAVVGERKRKLQYLPPRVSVEGNGIKRGLTPVEAAIVMQQPMDKILTMILFSVVKKNAAQVVSRDPMKIEVASPLPEGLNSYEVDFLKAMQAEKPGATRRELQDMMTNLVRAVSEKMRGFSRKETEAYYKDIMQRAWQQVESAQTPEVKMQAFDEAMDWTMLDDRFGDRTRNVFGPRPVIVPTWWGRYDPTFRGGGVSQQPTSPAPSPSTGQNRPPQGVNLPSLPGGDFAASVVGGMQSFASDIVGDITSFTGAVTQKTNPVPKSTSSSGRSGGGGGRSCACACACAGCACACAGGGR